MLRLVVLIMASLILFNASQAEQVEFVQGAKTIDAFEALHLFEQGATFIDVRDEFEYQLGHIRSAVHLDLKQEFNDLYLIETLDRNIPIVIYCNSAQCYRSAVATFLAVAWGYENVHYFKDGYFAWQALDLPMVMNYSQVDQTVPDEPKSHWRASMIQALAEVKVAKAEADIQSPIIEVIGY